jgi:N-methylhydantoinase A/oxoprolinase/acetone carboxylase beta subunit
MLSALIVGMTVAACGASFPVPTQRMADAESAERSARELGADSQPAAKLHLRLAQEQIAKAKATVEKGENQRADQLLVRAKADAELALTLAREASAKAELQRAETAMEGAPQ